MNYAEDIRVFDMLNLIVVQDLLRQSLKRMKLGLVVQEHGLWVTYLLLRGASRKGYLHSLSTVVVDSA